jgi:hypothetical protein
MNIEALHKDLAARILAEISDQIQFFLRNYTEMNRILQISVLSKFIPYNKLKEKLMSLKMPPVQLVTNVGIIDQTDINFNGIPLMMLLLQEQ